MAEGQDDASKTEEPTAKRMDDARKRGQVAVSREVNSWSVLLAATLTLAALAPSLADRTRAMLVGFLAEPHLLRVDVSNIRDLVLDVCVATAIAIAPIIAAVLAAGLAAGIVQIGWLYAPEAIQPKLSKISPMQGFKRLFSGASLVEFVKGLLKMAIVGWACWLVAGPEFDQLPLYILRDPSASLALMGAMTLKMLMATVAVMTLIAGADLAYQRIRLRNELLMSRTEIRDEYKEQEGDPMVKAKLRQIRQDRSRRRMMQAVPKADVVITNPTHYAVALRYDRDAMAAPIVVAKGLDRVALKIREIADANRVPIVENPPLARALHATVELDDPVPPEHYKAVAEVISFVWRRRGEASAGRRRDS
jgi:flagellar biosynthetic protein FlhB